MRMLLISSSRVVDSRLLITAVLLLYRIMSSTAFVMIADPKYSSTIASMSNTKVSFQKSMNLQQQQQYHHDDKSKSYRSKSSLLNDNNVSYQQTRSNMMIRLYSSTNNDNNNNDDLISSSSTSKTSLSPTEQILENERIRTTASPTSSSSSSSSSTTVSSNNEGSLSTVPIDIPSPILLASSMIAAIVSVGSLFQLLGIGDFTSSSTSAGAATSTFTPVPAIIALIGLPVAIYLFYAAIVKATIETEEDDRKFLSGK